MRAKSKSLVIGMGIFLVVGWAAGMIPAWGQSTPPYARRFSQVAISPEGSRLAWVEGLVGDNREPTGGTGILVEDVKAGSKPRRILASGEISGRNDGSAVWSPDGRRLAFLSDAEKSGQEELYVADVAAGTAQKLTSLTGNLADPEWSPDGKMIAFLFTENAPRAAGPLMPMTPETGVVESKVYEQRLTMVDVGSGQVRQLSPADMYVYEFDWAPNGQSFAVIAAHGEGDANWYVAQLYTLASGEMKAIYKPPLQIAGPRWSPDGKSIALIGGIMSDEGSTGGDIFVVPAAGGEARNVTPEIEASPCEIYWENPDKILFAENIDGQPGFSTLQLSTGKVSLLWTDAGVVSSGAWGAPSLSLAVDHETSAVIQSSAGQPPEIWAGMIGKWKQVTHVNDAVHPTWGEMVSRHWMDGKMKVQGWLMYPTHYDPNQKYPMVVVVHGGPASVAHSAWPWRFFNTYQLSERGYFVLFPNPRGSYGQGEAFTAANVKDFGYGDFRDILAGMDDVIRTLPVDTHRVGITGWSYGGFMTMWAVTQMHRFAAAVSGAGLSDWVSYYGENDIDEWMIPYFGKSVYEDPAVYARSAPINFVNNVKTPTLMLVGERDGECPAPQSREFWHALKTLGVETQLVIYPGEGHVFFKPEDQRDAMERLIGWFDKYLKPK